MSAHDRHLAGHSSMPVRCVCESCGMEWDGTYVSEYGAGWLEPHEQCPKCGEPDPKFEELDGLDIEERILEARGENF